MPDQVGDVLDVRVEREVAVANTVADAEALEVALGVRVERVVSVHDIGALEVAVDAQLLIGDCVPITQADTSQMGARGPKLEPSQATSFKKPVV